MMRYWLRCMFVAMFLVTAAAATLRAQSVLYLDVHAPIDERVNDLVSRMTLEEKALQLQHEAPAIPRLQVPAYRWWNESLHGVSRQGYMTVFPQAIGLAATWDRDMLHSVGEVISTEARARHNDALLTTSRDHKDVSMFGLDFWAPNVNIFRDPRWGRGQETYGEDPYLTGELAIQYIHGMQGAYPLSPRAIATPKHFAVHSGPESQRHSFDVDPSPHDLSDTYLPAFRAAITSGGAGSIMCSYNRIDGVPACANTKFLQQILRDEWKFSGYVVTDCGAVSDFVKGHHYSTDSEHAAVSALKAGVDVLCSSDGEVKLLPDAVKQGLLTESDIDSSVKRIFKARFELGLFDVPGSNEYSRIPLSEVNSPAHHALALKAAEEAIVLLKNSTLDGSKVLPLSHSVRTIAVIGPNASLIQALEGNYNGTAKHPSRPVDGIMEEFAGKAAVVYAQGSSHTAQTPVPIPRNVLRPATNSKEFGLKGEYFNNLTLSGTPALTRLDHEIDFDWDGDTPDPAVHRDMFSVRWSGFITAPGPGTYVFSSKFAKRWFDETGGENEAYRILIDGVPVSKGKNQTRPDAPYTFKDTKPHAIVIEYFHDFPRLDGGITVGWIPDESQLREEAVRVARSSDVVIAVVGLNSYTLEGEEYPLHIPGFSGGDRTDIELPDTQVKLLDALAATGKPIVIVLMNGSALAGDWVQRDAAALMEAWYPGEAGGEAIARTLSGANNPSGRLPITFYRSSADLPPFTDYSMQNRTYRYFKGKPLFGFGDGLSYTNFRYKHMRLSGAGKSVTKIQAGAALDVDVDLNNMGSISGDEVAELYLVPLDPKDPVSSPISTLRDFRRLNLRAGQTEHLKFTLNARSLSTVDVEGKRSVAAGHYRIVLGSGQPGRTDDDVLADFVIVGSFPLPQ